jgi:hypothetical protein
MLLKRSDRLRAVLICTQGTNRRRVGCDHVNDHSGSVNGGKFLGYLTRQIILRGVRW